MLVTLLIWIYSFVVFYVYGWGTLALLKRLLRLQQEASTIPFPITVIVGMAAVTTIASFLSLLMPLGGLAMLLILTGGAAIAIWARPFQRFHMPSYHFIVWILLILTGATVLENATHAPANSDTALYHAQAIHWIESYRVVPGLANLHDRFGFNSSWLILNAAFSLSFLDVQSFHLDSSLLTLAVTLYFLEGLQNLLGGDLSISSLIRTFFIASPFFIYNSELSSPSTDLPAFLLVLVVVALWIEKHEKTAGRFDLESCVLLMLSIFAITVKLSALPIALAAAWIVAGELLHRNFSRALALGLTGVAMLAPWLIRNVFLSGYLVFPLYQIDIFPLDWKYPEQSAATLAKTISTFARFPVRNWMKFSGLSFWAWFPIWFENLTQNRRVIFLLAMLSPFSLIWGRLYGSGTRFFRQYIVIALICWFGAVYWLLTAPDIRFGYGYLISAIILAMSLLLTVLLTRIPKLSSAVVALMIGALVSYQGYALVASLDTATFSQRILLPADYLASHADPCPIRNAAVFCRKEGFQCNYGSFPCIPSPRPNVEMRGPTLQDGFRYVP